MSVRVLNPGMFTTIQDLGRYGSQQYGVVVSGAMDSYSLRIANLLVGNREGEGVLEITLVGPKLQFESDQLIAITGGDLIATVDGATAPLWRPLLIRKGSILQFKSAIRGCRAYIAFAGGIAVPEVMGSKSTYVRAGIGGYKGRTLQKGDMFKCTEMGETAQLLVCQLEKTKGHFSWSVNEGSLINFSQTPSIRVLRGSEFDRFDKRSRYQFFYAHYTLTTSADRMGYRLEGPELLLKGKFELLSEGVTYGTIQVPSNGQPIILMADRQTTGGYPKIAQIISADLSSLAQLQPTASIHFTEVTLEEAERELLRKERIIHDIKMSIHVKARSPHRK